MLQCLVERFKKICYASICELNKEKKSNFPSQPETPPNTQQWKVFNLQSIFKTAKGEEWMRAIWLTKKVKGLRCEKAVRRRCERPRRSQKVLGRMMSGWIN